MSLALPESKAECQQQVQGCNHLLTIDAAHSGLKRLTDAGRRMREIPWQLDQETFYKMVDGGKISVGNRPSIPPAKQPS